VARRGGGGSIGVGPRCGGGDWRQRLSVVQGGGRGGVWWGPVVAREGKNDGAWASPGKRKTGQAQRKLQKFQINYVFEGNQIRNKFPSRDFSKFGVEFELHVVEALGFEFQSNLVEFE
jgi:hypothetical protein